MNRWQHPVPRIQRRLGREWSSSQMRLERGLWERLRPRSLTMELQESLLYSRYLPPTVAPTDPIFADAALRACGDPMPARHHYAYHVRHKAYIEPAYGYTILEPHAIVDEAFARVECLWDPSRRIYYPGTPSLAHFLLAKRLAKHGVYSVRREKAVVSLRGGFDDNIYHIISDLLPRLALLDEQGLDPSIPVVISPSPILRAFVSALEVHRGVARRRWLVQDGFYIEADEVIFARTDDATRDQIDHVLNTAAAPASTTSSTDRKLFITRTPGVGRDLSNMAEIVPILRQFDLEIVDPAVMTIEQQIEAFSHARIVVGLHGAGLTNLVFRGNRPLRMLEILPPYRVPLCFYAIAKKYGFDYDCVVGSGVANDKLGMKYSYTLDPTLLRTRLERLCSAADPRDDESRRSVSG